METILWAINLLCVCYLCRWALITDREETKNLTRKQDDDNA